MGLEIRGVSIWGALVCTGCGCSFTGAQGVLLFDATPLGNEVCWHPERPVAVGTEWRVSVNDDVQMSDEGTSGAEVASVTYTYSVDGDGSEVVAVVVHDRFLELRALASGAASIVVESSDGQSDRFTVEVSRPAQAALLDPLVTVLMESGWDGQRRRSAGDHVWLHPVAPTTLMVNEPLDLWLELTDAQGRSLGWTEGAVQMTTTHLALEPTGTYRNLVAIGAESGEGEVRVTDSEGALLVAHDFSVVRAAAPSQIELGVIDLCTRADECGSLVALVRAVVRDQRGEPVWQRRVNWTYTGMGELQPWDYDHGCDSQTCPVHRLDVAMLRLNSDGGSALPLQLETCVAASVEGEHGPVVRNITFRDGERVVGDGPCSDCSCSNDPSPHWYLALSMVGWVGARWRRRRGRLGGLPKRGAASQVDHGSGDGDTNF